MLENTAQFNWSSKQDECEHLNLAYHSILVEQLNGEIH